MRRASAKRLILVIAALALAVTVVGVEAQDHVVPQASALAVCPPEDQPQGDEPLSDELQIEDQSGTQLCEPPFQSKH